MVDPTLEDFALERRMRFGRNDHHWPERSLRWGSPLGRLIQIRLEDENQLTVAALRIVDRWSSEDLEFAIELRWAHRPTWRWN
jgi:hypothetical protein